MLFRKRHHTKVVEIGNVSVGGTNFISVQSMTNTDTRNTVETLEQINKIHKLGGDIVRVAVPDSQAAESLPEIVDNSPIPVVADIHFDYRLALKAIEAGIAKLRINPGNIGDKKNVEIVANAAIEKNVPIRIGVNAGSLENELAQAVREKRISLGEAMCRSALAQAAILEACDFHDIIISVKASHIPDTFKAYKTLAEACDYPLHIGITEAGSANTGIIKSAVGIGALLAEGIGDTIRVSLTGPPEEEIVVGRKILQSLDLRPYGPEIISCPTCGRTEVDVLRISEELEEKLKNDKTINKKNCKIAVMGCVVNGPGEAGSADIGFAGGKDCGIIFRNGKKICKVSAGEAVDKLIEEIRALDV